MKACESRLALGLGLVLDACCFCYSFWNGVWLVGFESDLRFVAYVLFESGDKEMVSVVAVLFRYEENAKWLSKHYEELKKMFTDEWVAVLNKAVVDHDRALDRLVKRLRKKYLEAYNEIAVEYVTAKEIELIL